MADSQSAFNPWDRKKTGIKAEFDAELVAELVVKLGAEADQGHGNWRELPFGAVVIPQIPRGVDLASAIVEHKFTGGFEKGLWVGSGREFAFEQGRLSVFQRVDADDGPSFGELRIRKKLQHAAEVPEHVRFVVAWEPAGEIEAVGHLTCKYIEQSWNAVLDN